MKWQTIVRRIANATTAPVGVAAVPVVLRETATNTEVGRAATDADGVAAITIDGVPGPTRLAVQSNNVTRYQESVVRGPAGPTDISEIRHVLHAIGGPTGAGVIPGFGQQFAVLPATGTLAVTVAPGQAVIPGGFLYTQYGTVTLTFTPETTNSFRTAAIVAEADSNESSPTYGRTRLRAIQNEALESTAGKTVIATVRVTRGATSITVNNISQSMMPLALEGFRQSEPVVVGNQLIGPLTKEIINGGAISYSATAAGLTAGRLYDITATCSVVFGVSIASTVTLKLAATQNQVSTFALSSMVTTVGTGNALSVSQNFTLTPPFTWDVEMYTFPTNSFPSVSFRVQYIAVPRS